MLTVYVDTVNGNNIVRNVEEQFAKIKLTGSEIERKLISQIEQGTYNDEYSFIDRFGYKLYNTELSTGCKAALCVVRCPELIIDLIECGLNARDIIIGLCKDGNVLIQENGVTIVDYFEQPIDVKIDKYRITSVDRLNKYIFSERPFEPVVSSEDIECIG
ncbi:MAG: hypothetical protein J6A94_11160 [Lachnospiraceae bacterium]|nr:hypothetical protein [Lachnospiraceae bacterium]